MSIDMARDRLGALLAELVEEAVQRGGVLALLAPDELARGVVRDQGHVRVALAPRDLVDAGDEELVEAIGIEPGLHHPLDDASDGGPVDAHEAAQRGLVHGGGQPPDQVLEVVGEAGARARAKGTPSVRTPWVGQASRRRSARTSRRQRPRSRWRQVDVTGRGS